MKTVAVAVSWVVVAMLLVACGVSAQQAQLPKQPQRPSLLRSCQELRRKTEIYRDVIANARNEAERKLAGVLAELITWKQRYRLLELKMRAKKDQPLEKEKPANSESDDTEDE